MMPRTIHTCTICDLILTFMKRLFVCILLLSTSCFTQSAQKQQLLWTQLQERVSQAAASVDGVISVSILDLTSGEQILIHADELMPQASSIKIAVLLELYRQDQAGKVKLTDEYVVRSEDLVPDSDIMGGLTPSVTRITLRDLATMMVAVSDNSATNVLINRLGMESINATLSSTGLKQTRLQRKMMDLKAAEQGRENVSSAREMTELLRQVFQGKLLDRAHTADFWKVLSTHKDSDIPRDLPETLMIANKPGSLEGVRTDSGVIFVPNRPFAISVMATYLRDERTGEAAITRIARLAYDYFDRVGRASNLGRVISPNNSGVKP
jgi:beta-lactamase class A